jgi:hypothetical protein
VSRRRTTFGKLQRDRDKQAKARAKIERRQERSEQGDDDTDETATPAPAVDQAAVLAQLADLHAAFDDGKISFDDFESRRDELTSKLRVD